MAVRKIALEEAFTIAAFHDDEQRLTRSLNPVWGDFVDKRIADLADLRLAEMDSAGIDVQVLSPTSPGIQSIADADEAVRVATEANDLVAGTVQEHPTRFAAFAALACQDPDAAVAELERCVTEHGFVGATGDERRYQIRCSRSTRFGSVTYMGRPPRVVAVEPLGGHRLRLQFSDDLVRELDFSGVLLGGIFAPLEDETYFARVEVDQTTGTICWPNGVDLDPDVLHGDHPAESGTPPRLIREHRLRPSA